MKKEVTLRKFNALDNFRFLSLTLNPKTAKELENNFFQYIWRGFKEIFTGQKSYKFVILLDNKFAGSVAIFNKNELGYFILPSYRKKGIGTKAVREIMNKIKKNIPLKKVMAKTNINNFGSIKILRKNNFKLTKTNKKTGKVFFERNLK